MRNSGTGMSGPLKDVEIGVPDIASVAINTVVNTKYEIIDRATGAKIGKWGGPATSVVLGTVDVVDAARNGTAKDVAVQTGGLGGSIVGGIMGAELGAKVGSFLGTPGAAVGAVAGGVVGSVVGEKGVESVVDGASDVLFAPKQIKGDYVPVGSVSSARLSGQRGVVHVGEETNALDVISETNRNAGNLREDGSLRHSPSTDQSPRENPSVSEPATKNDGGQKSSQSDHGEQTSQKTAPQPQPVPAHTKSPASAPADNQNENSGGGKSSQSDHNDNKAPVPAPRPDRQETTSVKDNKSSGSGSDKPILIDLDGDGVELAQLSSSNVFMDVVGDGKKHRTAWAGAGDGVLVHDTGNDGVINLANEIDFTSWDPTAKSDIEALRNVFDTNHDGKLNSADNDWTLFKVLVTNQDGSTTLKTLAELGITEFDLRTNNHEQTFADGSKIVGTTSFTRADGSTGTIADAVLAHDIDGYVVSETVTTNADGSTKLEHVARNADGSLAKTTTTTTSADGLARDVVFDDDGDGVADRVHHFTEVHNADGSKTETFRALDGSDTILVRQRVTNTSADGKTITISHDRDGSGVNDFVEKRTVGLDGSLSVVETSLNDDGTVKASVTTTTSADGLSKTAQIDVTGDGVVNKSTVENTSVAADGTRTETVTDYKGSSTVAANRVSSTVTNTSADGSSKTIADDLDGDGATDVTTSSTIVRNADGSTTTTKTLNNGDGSVRSQTVTFLSADGNDKTVQSDIQGDGIFDATNSDSKVVNADGSTTHTITHTNGDGTLASKTVSTWSADGATRSTSIDSDGDGSFDQIQTVQLVGTDSVETKEVFSGNGTSLLSKSITTTSSDGLHSLTTVDQNGDGVVDSRKDTTKVVNADGSSLLTQITTNGDGTVQIGKSETTTSADGLTVSVDNYVGASATIETRTVHQQVQNADGSLTTTTWSYKGANLVLSGKVVEETSADKLTITQSTHRGANAAAEKVVTTVTALDGSKTITTTTYSPDGSAVVNSSVTSVSSDGLSSATTTDVNGDGIVDLQTNLQKSLATDGTSSTIRTEFAGNATLAANQVAQANSSSSANGFVRSSATDLDGDGIADRQASESLVLNADGSKTREVATFNGDGTIQTSRVVETINAAGLTKTTSEFQGPSTSADLVTTQVTSFAADGSRTDTTSKVSANAATVFASTTTVSANGLQSSSSIDLNGDGINDRTSTRATNTDGSVTSTTSTYDASGTLTSKQVQNVSGDGLSTNVTVDIGGDGLTDRSFVQTRSLNGDGSTSLVETNYGADGTVIDKKTETVSADARSTSASWEDSVGVIRSRTTNMTVDADGTTAKNMTNYNADGTIHDAQTTSTSADGSSRTIAIDSDGNGVDDQTIHTTLNADGTRSQSSMDGTVLFASGREYGSLGGRYTTTSADGLAISTLYDSDGDGLAETKISNTSTLSSDGSLSQTITNYSLSGGDPLSTDPIYSATAINNTTVTSSANRMHTTTSWDVDGDGIVDASRDAQASFALDGSKTTTTTDTVGGAVHSVVRETVSADGLQAIVEWDRDGSGVFEANSSTITTQNADGSKTKSVEVSTNQGASFYHKTTTTSADGQTVTKQVDANGAILEAYSEVTNSTVLADGTEQVTHSRYDAGGLLSEKVFDELSGNGRVASTSIDADGDGSWDQINTTTFAGDGSSSTISVDYSSTGAKTKEVRSTLSFDGLQKHSEIDMDGDGVVDRISDHSWHYLANGAVEDTLNVYQVSQKAADGTVSAISPVLWRTSKVWTSADGHQSRAELDVDADGVVDQVSVTEHRVDGSTTQTTTANSTAQAIVPSTEEVRWESALGTSYYVAASSTVSFGMDGLSKVISADYDGNGTFEHSEYWITRIDGTQIAAITDVGAAGEILASGTIVVSADGRTTTLTKDSNGDGVYDAQETTLQQLDGHFVKTTGSVPFGTTVVTIADFASGSLNLSISGSTVADTLVGGAGTDYLSGGAGNDILDGREGGDIMAGGLGDDIYFVDSANDLLSESIGEGYDTVRSGVSFVLADNFESLQLTGVGSTSATGNAADNVISGNVASNSLSGLAGNDIISGGAGDDTLDGGDGNDRLIGGSGADTINGGLGTDLASYEDASSGVFVHTGDLALNTGDAQGDTFTSIEGFLGSAFDDELIDVSNGALLYGEDGNDTLTAAGVDSQIHGGNGNDFLYGNVGVDQLSGDAGNDELHGEAGDDILDGGLGDDWYAGGAGNDTLVFRANSGFDGVGGFEVHAGGSAGDVIELHGQSTANFTDLMLGAEEWGGNAWIHLDGANTIVLYGVSLSSLTADDFRFLA